MATVFSSDGTKLIFGIPDKKLPLKGFQDGRIRLRYRPDDFAVATVKNAFGASQYYIKEEDGFFAPSYVKAVNLTAQ